jgi:hypothetical protein
MSNTFGLLLSGESDIDKSNIIDFIVNKYNKVLINVPMSIIKTKTDLINIINNLYYGSDVISYDNRIYLFKDIDFNSWEDNSKKSEDIAEKINTEDKSSGDLSHTNNTSKINSTYNDIDSLSINSILNIIDNLVEFQGRMIVITTNNADALDSNLLSSVKMDMNIHIGNHNKNISTLANNLKKE